MRSEGGGESVLEGGRGGVIWLLVSLSFSRSLSFALSLFRSLSRARSLSYSHSLSLSPSLTLSHLSLSLPLCTPSLTCDEYRGGETMTYDASYGIC